MPFLSETWIWFSVPFVLKAGINPKWNGSPEEVMRRRLRVNPWTTRWQTPDLSAGLFGNTSGCQARR